MSDGNKVAPAGQVFVCGACGKRSKDEYGDQEIDSGWDESCFLHAVLVYENSIEMQDGRVVNAKAVTGGAPTGPPTEKSK